MTTSHGQTLKEALDLKEGHTVLVTDRIDTDGRFVLYQSAATAAASSHVLWLGCGVFTKSLILSSLRKMGYSSATVTSADASLVIHSIPEMIEADITTRAADNTASAVFDEKAFANNLLDLVERWLVSDDDGASQPRRRLCVIDDVTSLATLLGPRTTYSFLRSIRQRAVDTKHPFTWILRCSSDAETEDTEEWMGAGGETLSRWPFLDPQVYMERSLIELADCCIDITSLSSGYSREAHGRMVVTDEASSTQRRYNYVLMDQEVRVLPVQQH